MKQPLNTIEQDDLDSIIQDYKKDYETYKNYGEFIIKELSVVNNIHALNYRIKEPEHLRKKIIKKNREGRNINLSNYKDEITDLIGIRVLHIFKDEWKNIDKHIRNKYKPSEIIAYVRKGDVKTSVFNKYNFHVTEHKYGYRSLHYTYKTELTNLKMNVEIQVRTIFEEAWSEIDHRVRYPNHTDNSLIEEYSLVLNRLSGLGDEMGMNLKNITTNFEQRDNEIEDYVNKLSIEEFEKTKLLEKIQNRNTAIGLGAALGLINSLQSKK